MVFCHTCTYFFLAKEHACGSSILVGKEREAAAPLFWLPAIINHNLPFPNQKESYLHEFV